MTMNISSKMNPGWKNIFKNKKMLLLHTKNSSVISRIRVSTHILDNLKKSKALLHKENQTRRIRLDEQTAQVLLDCVSVIHSIPHIQ